MDILWRRLDRPGHEACRLGERSLIGTAVFSHDGEACSLSYSIHCDASWRTERARVEGWVGARVIDVVIEVDGDRRWRLNGAEIPAVAGCMDVDLNFSPSTNTLPVRRLKLEIGAEERVRAAWLKFPSFHLEVLEQTYRRIEARRYVYRSGNFEAQILVNEAGLALDYSGIWVAEGY